MNKQEIRRFNRLLEVAMNAPQECQNPSCTAPAINSHVLQRRGGVLKSIAVEGFVMERTPADAFNPRRFVRKGIKKSDVLSFVGFCGEKHNDCDRIIFNEIEISAPDFTNYRHNMLFAYRAHLCEMHKRKAWAEAYAKLAAIGGAPSEIKELAKHHNRLYQYNQLLRTHIRYLYEKELFKNTLTHQHNFEFQYFPLPTYIEIAACGSFVVSKRVNESHVDSVLTIDPLSDSLDGIEPYTFSIALVPINGTLHFILGYQIGMEQIEGIQLRELKNITTHNLYKLISDILIKYIDTWCISIPFHKSLKSSGNLDRINATMNVFVNRALANAPVSINIFESFV